MIDEYWLSPIEEYNGVLYKRDDLFSPFENGVNGGKARQAYSLLKTNADYIRECCNNTVITATNKDSPQGIIISTIANYLGMKSIVAYGYPYEKERLLKNKLVKRCEDIGGIVEIVAKAAYPNVVESKIKQIVSEHNYFPIKFGINAEQNSDSIFGVIERQVENIPRDLNTLVIPVGSGIIFSGIIIGLIKYGIKPKRVVGIISGMDCVNDIEKYLAGYNAKRKNNDVKVLFESDSVDAIEYELYRSDLGYHDKIFIDEPFSIDPIYEAKTIRWFDNEVKCGNIDLSEKNLIWIVGNQRKMY